MTVARALHLAVATLLLAGCGPGGKLLHDRHSMSRLYVAEGGDELVFEASVSPEYPADSDAGEQVRLQWITMWLEQRDLCPGGYDVVDRRRIGSAADNPYWHDLRYRLRCRPVVETP